MHDAEKSVFQSDLPLKEKRERARTELRVVDERTSEIYRLLVNEGKVFTFIAGKPDRVKAGQGEAETPDDEDDYSPVVLPQPDDNELDERGLARRHYDTSLQTRMTPTGLQRRLLALYYDARTLEEEQGVNILFLALGMLKWIDPNNKENIRHAPLILVPVRIERGAAGERFRLRVRPEDQTANLSVKRHPKLTPDRRPILTPLGVERCGERPTGWSWPGLRSPVGRVG